VSRRVLVVEPDPSGRSLMELVLAADGHAPEAVGSVHDAEALLDAEPFELAVVAEIGGRGAALEEIRWLRREHPSIPVIVTGAVLSRRIMAELVRLGVVDVVAKPFTPDELRDAVTLALARCSARHEDALEYTAALDAARRALDAGAAEAARSALRRAQATSPLDPEIMALWARLAELEGHDDDAGRAYRAALALRHDEDFAGPDPYEGLARIEARAAAGRVS
jgi:DNA-binding response OmpR family regulator